MRTDRPGLLASSGKLAVGRHRPGRWRRPARQSLRRWSCASRTGGPLVGNFSTMPDSRQTESRLGPSHCGQSSANSLSPPRSQSTPRQHAPALRMYGEGPARVAAKMRRKRKVMENNTLSREFCAFSQLSPGFSNSFELIFSFVADSQSPDHAGNIGPQAQRSQRPDLPLPRPSALDTLTPHPPLAPRHSQHVRHERGIDQHGDRVMWGRCEYAEQALPPVCRFGICGLAAGGGGR